MGSFINTVSLQMAEWLANQLKVDHHPSAFTVLQHLYDVAFKAVFPLVDLHVVFCIFQETVRPFLHFANQLAINGCFFDPHEEFEVEFNEQLLAGECVDFWDRFLMIKV